MVVNELLMQFQADILDVPSCARSSPRPPRSARPTPPGSPSASGRAPTRSAANWGEDARWEPQMDEDERERLFRTWKKAVTRTFDWVDDDTL